MTASSKPFSAAVLAGGRSTRMGADKAFLRVGDELLLERQLRCVRDCGADDILLSGRPAVDYSSFDARVVYDRYPDGGPLAGVAALLTSAKFQKLIVLAVDMPRMEPAMLRKLVGYSEDGVGCVPFSEDGFQPLAAIYPKAALPLVETCLQQKAGSIRGFAERAFAQGLVRRLIIEPEERIYFTNWNYPSDWSPS